MSWVIITSDRKFRSQNFNTIEQAKRSVVCDYTAAQKDSLNYGQIIHIVDGVVISSIVIHHLGAGIMEFTGIHLVNDIPLENY